MEEWVLIDDYKASLDDLEEVGRAVDKARCFLMNAMAGEGQTARESYVFHIGFAYGRLSRIRHRLFSTKEKASK